MIIILLLLLLLSDAIIAMLKKLATKLLLSIILEFECKYSLKKPNGILKKATKITYIMQKKNVGKIKNLVYLLGNNVPPSNAVANIIHVKIDGVNKQANTSK